MIVDSDWTEKKEERKKKERKKKDRRKNEERKKKERRKKGERKKSMQTNLLFGVDAGIIPMFLLFLKGIDLH